MTQIVSLILTIIWIIGVVIAKGFWSTFFALIFPFYSWYIVIEHFLIKYNLL